MEYRLPGIVSVLWAEVGNSVYCGLTPLRVISSIKTTEAVVVGSESTGAILSAPVSRQGEWNVILEQDSSISTDPRGVALDEDGIWTLQGLGLYDKVYVEIGQRESSGMTWNLRASDVERDSIVLIHWYLSSDGDL